MRSSPVRSAIPTANRWRRPASTPPDRSPKDAPPRQVLIPTWFANSVDLSAARPLDLPPGARLSGIDINLIRSRLGRVTVHVDVPTGMAPVVGLRNGGAGVDATIQ